jgi:hypothetical protein
VRWLLVVLRVIGAAALIVLAGVALGVSIAHSGYDPHTNRAPAARVVLAAAALVPALASLRFALPAPRADGPRRRIAAGTGMVFLSLLFLAAWWIVTLSTGNL